MLIRTVRTYATGLNTLAESDKEQLIMWERRILSRIHLEHNVEIGEKTMDQILQDL